jgi:hypothetical protein
MRRNGKKEITEILRCVTKKRINAVKRVNAERADAPPIAAIFENGESAWVYATLTQPNPPNGNLLRSSSNKM